MGFNSGFKGLNLLNSIKANIFFFLSAINLTSVSYVKAWKIKIDKFKHVAL